LNTAAAVQAAQSCQFLLSAGPMALAEKILETGQQFQSVVVFSSSSVETKQESGNAAERNQIQAMLSLESSIQHRAEIKGVKLAILRPTLIYGCGLDTNISRLASWIRRFGFMPVNGSAGGLRQPVHADDLASVAITAMLSKDVLPPVLSLTGGDTLSYSDMVIKIFAALGKPARLVRLPERLFVLLVNLANTFKIGGKINREMVKRQGVDLVFDDQQARRLLNYNPRPFAPVEADFSLPDF
jgi:nucleoside-diphosphate-sugar epimerase